MTERAVKIATVIEILATMNVPEFRIFLSRANIRWMLRNLRVQHNDHPDIDRLMLLLKELHKSGHFLYKIELDFSISE